MKIAIGWRSAAVGRCLAWLHNGRPCEVVADDCLDLVGLIPAKRDIISGASRLS